MKVDFVSIAMVVGIALVVVWASNNVDFVDDLVG